MYKHFLKRLIDLILSLIGIILSSPFWIIAILGIEINDFGPIFYKSKRIGKDNKEFSMLKFRSMRVDKKANESSLRPDEDRIFFWGRVIRALKIDELPQLLNIFAGHMAIVGPRPVSKDQFEIFRTGKCEITKTVRPGLTGPDALYDYVYGDKFSDPKEYEEKVLPIRKELGCVYVKKQSFFFDFKMFFETAWCVVCSIFRATPKRVLKSLEGYAKTKDE